MKTLNVSENNRVSELPPLQTCVKDLKASIFIGKSTKCVFFLQTPNLPIFFALIHISKSFAIL